MDALLHPVNDTDGDDTLLGCIAKDTPEVQLLEKWTQLINSSNFQLSDITTGLADLLAAKEPSKLTDLNPPANLPSSTMKQFVIPKLEETNISDQELPESVPDPEPQPKSSKRKKPNKFTAQKQGSKIWTEEEEVALTHAWISAQRRINPFETDRSKRSESKETLLHTDRPKRSRTSESNEYSVNPSDVQEIPVVQNECKRSVSSSRKDSGVELNELNNYKEKIEEFIRVQQKMMESKCDKQVLVDMQVLQLSTNGVEGEDLETMLAVKKAIREKYKKFM